MKNHLLLITIPFPQASLESEKQRAEDAERKNNEAQESIEEKKKKLEDTEKKVHQLQESLTRYHTELGLLTWCQKR